jgi:hypothetical protein
MIFQIGITYPLTVDNNTICIRKSARSCRDSNRSTNPPSWDIVGMGRTLPVECPHNTGIPGRRPGRRLPGRLVGIVSSLEAKFSEKLFENRPGSTT